MPKEKTSDIAHAIFFIKGPGHAEDVSTVLIANYGYMGKSDTTYEKLAVYRLAVNECPALTDRLLVLLDPCPCGCLLFLSQDCHLCNPGLIKGFPGASLVRLKLGIRLHDRDIELISKPFRGRVEILSFLTVKDCNRRGKFIPKNYEMLRLALPIPDLPIISVKDPQVKNSTSIRGL